MGSLLRRQTREAVLRRARGCCEYCWSQERFATQAFSIEHIIPRSAGGPSTLANLALACQGCNNHKYTKTEALDPITLTHVRLYYPRQHQWTDHLVWNADYTLILGLTPIGRATVEALQLNRSGLVNLRRVLFTMGEHPPLLSG